MGCRWGGPGFSSPPPSEQNRKLRPERDMPKDMQGNDRQSQGLGSVVSLPPFQLCQVYPALPAQLSRRIPPGVLPLL